MGTDNIHSRKKAGSFERRKPVKSAGKRILVVCEGSKTEPFYFKEIRHSLRLKTATIEVCGKECGSDPKSVYDYAVKLDSEDKYSVYDNVYCVIDTDDHKTLQQALDLIAAKGERYIAVLSSPCFEYWLLLHYVLHRTSFKKSSTKSIGEVVESTLRNHDKAYDKGKAGVWGRYKDRLGVAVENSKATLKSASATGNLNPSTNVHVLVEALTELK